MSDSPDFRVCASLFDHPKFIRLEATHGAPGVVSLFRLWGWVRRHRPSGDLAGLTDAEIAVVCAGSATAGADAGALALVRTLSAQRWLDGDEGSRSVHGWQERNGWASAGGARTLAARVAAMVKQCRRVGMTADAYLDAQGGEISRDTALREALRDGVANAGGKGKPKRKSADAGAGAVRPHSARTSPVSDPVSVPDPAPKGGRGGETAASRPTSPVPGSAAAPPRSGSDAATPGPVVVCVDCRKAPPAPGRSICASCAAPKVATPIDAAAMLKAALGGRKAVPA